MGDCLSSRTVDPPVFQVLHYDNGQVRYRGWTQNDWYHGSGTEFDSYGNVLRNGRFHHGRWVEPSTLQYSPRQSLSIHVDEPSAPPYEESCVPILPPYQPGTPTYVPTCVRLKR
jgi:hypothetical protein